MSDENMDSESSNVVRIQNSTLVPIGWVYAATSVAVGVVIASLIAFFELRERVAILELVCKVKP